jgi:hypothetical protein
MEKVAFRNNENQNYFSMPSQNSALLRTVQYFLREVKGSVKRDNFKVF